MDLIMDDFGLLTGPVRVDEVRKAIYDDREQIRRRCSEGTTKNWPQPARGEHAHPGFARDGFDPHDEWRPPTRVELRHDVAVAIESDDGTPPVTIPWKWRFDLNRVRGLEAAGLEGRHPLRLPVLLRPYIRVRLQSHSAAITPSAAAVSDGQFYAPAPHRSAENNVVHRPT